MKKVGIAIIAIISISLVCMSFTNSRNAILHIMAGNGAKISWNKDIHDFGNIPQGKPVSIEFSFTNEGTEPVMVADVVTSCGCTASNYSKEPIMPGKSSSITVSYNAASTGDFNKTITVNFNEEGSKKLLTIKGHVK